MTKSKLVFDPFSEEFFNGAWDIYRRMQEEAPVYYNDEYDFYALTRHEDVAAGLKDFETYSSAYGIDLSMVRSGADGRRSRSSSWTPPTIATCAACSTRSSRRAPSSRSEQMVIEKIDKYLSAADPDYFDVVQDFSGSVPGRGDHDDAGRAGGARAADPALDRRCRCTREPGQVEVGEEGMQANINTAMLLLRAGQAAPRRTAR